MRRGLLPVAAICGIALFTFVGCADEGADVKPIAAPPDNLVKEANRQADENLKKGQEFLEANKKKPGVKTLPEGVQYLVLKEGTGKQPKLEDVIEFHYHGMLIDGTVFQSSIEQGKPLSAPLKRLIPGWKVALPLMKQGAKWRLFIPADLAYGRKAPPTIGPNQALIFDIELLHVGAK